MLQFVVTSPSVAIKLQPGLTRPSIHVNSVANYAFKFHQITLVHLQTLTNRQVTNGG